MNGGYILIDCVGLDLTESDPQTISGLFDKLDTAQKTGKPVLLCGIKTNDGTISSPVSVGVSGTTTKTVLFSIVMITVTDEDAATVTILTADEE